MTTEAVETIMNMSALDAVLATRGIDADPVQLLLLAHAARDLGVSQVLIDVMVDEAQPEVARIRAYARVSSAVASRFAGLRAMGEGRVLQAA
jgi:hypothetical protein